MHTPTIVFAHANGIPAATYSCLFDKLSPFQIHFIDRLGHSEHKIRRNWEPLKQELTEFIRQQPGPIIGLGHSLGAYLHYMVAHDYPKLYKGLIMMDPPMKLGWKMKMFGLARSLGLSDKIFPLAQKAKQRRNNFTNTEEAYKYWRRKAFFRNFTETCFENYVKHALVQSGDFWELSFKPEVESKIFATLPSKIDFSPLKFPAFLLYSASYEVLTEPEILKLKQRLDSVELLPIATGGHMFPLEFPEETASVLQNLIKNEILVYKEPG